MDGKKRAAIPVLLLTGLLSPNVAAAQEAPAWVREHFCGEFPRSGVCQTGTPITCPSAFGSRTGLPVTRCIYRTEARGVVYEADCFVLSRGGTMDNISDYHMRNGSHATVNRTRMEGDWFNGRKADRTFWNGLECVTTRGTRESLCVTGENRCVR